MIKKILVLGHTGQLGSALSKEFQKYSDYFDFVGLNSSDLDIRNREQVDMAFSRYLPDIVVNTVAYTNVEQAESEPRWAFELNAFGAGNVASACKEIKAGLIHISSDYVFGCHQQKVLTEFDDTNPLNNYGMSKLAGEMIVRSIMNDSLLPWYVIRTSSLYGNVANASKGTFLLNMLTKLKTDEKVHLNNINFMSPTFVEDLSKYIRNILNHPSGLYHAANFGTVTPYDFIKTAVNIIHKLKISGDYNLNNIILNNVSNSKVERPRFSFLGTSKVTNYQMPGWEISLEGFLSDNKDLF